MSQFGFMTVKGVLHRRPSGMFTYSAEYPDTIAGIDIYDDLKKHAVAGRSARWPSRANATTVIGSGIYPAIVDSHEYNVAVMSIESWQDHEKSRGGSEARAPIKDSVPTAWLFDMLRAEALNAWQANANAGHFNSLGYVAICNFQLLT